MFPNKIRCETDNVCLGERKIVTLMREGVVRSIADDAKLKEALCFYKDIKREAKAKMKKAPAQLKKKRKRANQANI